MDPICQISNEIIALKNLQFSLMTLMAVVGVAGAYMYLGQIRVILHRVIGAIGGILGFIGAGFIGFLFLYNKIIC